jgi:hypothetical protein
MEEKVEYMTSTNPFNSEQVRIPFVEGRDGKEACMEFVKTTYSTYRRSLMQSRKRGHEKPHHATLPEYRWRFILSCVEFRRYLYGNHQS